MRKSVHANAKPQDPRRCRAFSLVEVIVVVGVIGLLMALLLPALRSARESAQRVQCASQLHQIGTALQIYANTNGGWLPAFSAWHTWPPGEPDDTDGPAWTIEMMPYLGPPDGKVYHCPSFPIQFDNYFLAAIWSSVNGRSAMKLSDVRMASRFVLSGDVSQPSIYPPPYGSSTHSSPDIDLSDEGVTLYAFPDEGGYLMHRGGNNALFDDMHVEAFRTYDRLRLTFDPTTMRNWQETRDNLPVE